MSSQRRLVVAVALVGVAFGLRATGLGFQSLWRDEVDAIRFSTAPLRNLAVMFTQPGHNGPLFYLLLRPWLELVGRSEVALRFFSVLWGTLAIPLAYRLARRMEPTRTLWPFAAALLVATSPYLVWYSQEGKMYALGSTLVLLSMNLYLHALQRGGAWRWLFYVAVTTAAIYVHLIAALVVPVQAIIFLLAPRPTRSLHWRAWLLAMGALTLPYVPLVRWQLPMLLGAGETGYAFVPLNRMLLSLLASFSLGVVHDLTFWTATLFLGLLLLATLLCVESRRGRTALGVLGCWLLLPIFSFFLITLLRPMFTARYLIFVTPAYLLLLAAGLTVLARQSRILGALLLCALLVLNGWGLVLQARTPLKADFRAATAFVSQHMDPTDLLLFQIPYGRHSFDYYYRPAEAAPPTEPVPGEGGIRVFLPLLFGGTKEPYLWAEGPYTNAGMTPEALAKRMQEITTRGAVIWYIASEVSLWDERGLTQSWLNEHASLVEEAQFTRVAAYRYVLP